jgi:hypothetical protein
LLHGVGAAVVDASDGVTDAHDQVQTYNGLYDPELRIAARVVGGRIQVLIGPGGLNADFTCGLTDPAHTALLLP